MFSTITCGPVSTHGFPSGGLVANGSSFDASDPPISMYPNASFSAGGFLCAIHALIHSSPFLSRHIGSTPGDGPSGTHVHPLVPARRLLTCIFSSMAMIAASRDTASGAADIALLII